MEMMANARIILPETLRTKCLQTAEQRESIKARHTDRRVSPGENGIAEHYCGLCGEASVAELFERPDLVDWSITKHGDPGIDLIINGANIQVKTSRYSPPYMRFDIDGSQALKDKVHFIVVCWIKIRKAGQQDVEIWGWLHREEFRATCKVKNLGHGNRLVREPPFHHIKELVETISE
jgi:hypothetical protein